eukprot:414275_1
MDAAYGNDSIYDKNDRVAQDYFHGNVSRRYKNLLCCRRRLAQKGRGAKGGSRTPLISSQPRSGERKKLAEASSTPVSGKEDVAETPLNFADGEIKVAEEAVCSGSNDNMDSVSEVGDRNIPLQSDRQQLIINMLSAVAQLIRSSPVPGQNMMADSILDVMGRQQGWEGAVSGKPGGPTSGGGVDKRDDGQGLGDSGHVEIVCKDCAGNFRMSY